MKLFRSRSQRGCTTCIVTRISPVELASSVSIGKLRVRVPCQAGFKCWLDCFGGIDGSETLQASIYICALMMLQVHEWRYFITLHIPLGRQLVPQTTCGLLLS